MKYLSEYKALNLYDDMLDECYEEIKIGSLTYLPSQVLKEVDPIAYRCGFIDWLDSENLTTDEDEADEDEADEEEEEESEE